MLSPLAALAWALALLPLVVWRVQLEDGVLALRDPQRFADYRGSVPALLPLRILDRR
jgi:hypothetical protein